MRENFMCIVSSQYVKQFYIHNTYIQRNTGIGKNPQRKYTGILIVVILVRGKG